MKGLLTLTYYINFNNQYNLHYLTHWLTVVKWILRIYYTELKADA